VVIEALAHRRPVITTRVSGIPELVVDGKTGILIEPDDADALRAALGRVRDDPEAAQTMADAGRIAVEAEFELNANVDRQLALFEAHRAQPRQVSR
jgi:glycosyltransferase involved in cell wall biosynthesis